MFKKKQFKTRKKNNPKIIATVGFIAIFGVFFLALLVVTQVSSEHFNIYKEFLNGNSSNKLQNLSQGEQERLKALQEQKAELKRKKEEDEKKINILIVGRGGYGNDAPELTDSIILASIHKEKNHISMLSIPRDIYVNYDDINKNGEKISGKINGLYVHYLSQLNNEEKAIAKLQEKITQMTNEKIDYYVNLDFNGFVKLVDALGGIHITVPQTLVDYKYPDNNHGYQTFVLRKGSWLLDGKVALKYVRSRKNTGGDFGRSQRQQQVISALKEKILSGGSLSSPTRIKNLYNIFQKYVTTDISLLKATQIFTQIKFQTDTKVYSSGLNTRCIKKDECQKGGYLYYPQRIFFNGQSVLLEESADNTHLDIFTNIQEYADVVFNSPKLFDEKYKISIFSKVEDKEEALKLKENLKKIGLEINVLERIGNIPQGFNTSTENTEPDKQIKKRQNLHEYNLSKNNTTSTTTEEQKAISQEYDNASVKIIINSIPRESKTLAYLKKYLQLTDDNIVENVNGPKYARDQNTKIEIIYTQ